MLSRPRLVAGAVALGVFLAVGGVAVAGLPYTVKVKASQASIPTGNPFKITASGVARTSSQLLVYLTSAGKCATTAVSAAHGSKRAINTRVSAKFSKTVSLIAGPAGDHLACAYLTSPTSAKTQHAHGGAKYNVNPGIY